MLGTLFDKNPNLIYYFEPLTGFNVPNGNISNRSQEIQIDLLAKAFSCEIPRKSQNVLHEIKSLHICEEKLKSSSCQSRQFWEESVAQWYGSSRFCQKPFCESENISLKNRQGDCKRFCEDPFLREKNPNFAQNENYFFNTCQSSLGVAIKELRIDSLSRFERLIAQPEKFGDFKFIHLVRDPRPMLASRIKLAESYDKLKWGNMWPMTTERSMTHQCDKDARIYREIQSNPEIRKRTMIIRYEDMSSDPWKRAKEIYDFLEMEFDQITKAQFKLATGIHRRKRRNAELQKSRQPEIPDIFGVTKTKSSSELLEGWRDKAKDPKRITKYLLLERNCREMMNLYGYNRIMKYHRGEVLFDAGNSVDLNWTLHF